MFLYKRGQYTTRNYHWHSSDRQSDKLSKTFQWFTKMIVLIVVLKTSYLDQHVTHIFVIDFIYSLRAVKRFETSFI